MITDLRKYTAPARGSKAWMEIFKRRTAVERVNAYLKGYFQLNNVRYRTGKRVKVHFNLVTLVYNASKLAADRMNAMLNQNKLHNYCKKIGLSPKDRVDFLIMNHI